MNFSVLVLGSGAATPTHNRHCSAQLVSVCGAQMLVDCGEATQDRLRQYHKKIQSVKAAFISHLHGDHFFGLPGLVSTMHLCGRTEPFTVYAPAGSREALQLLLQVSGTAVRYPLEIVEMDFAEPTVICDERFFQVRAFPLRHSVPTYGFLFEEKDPLLNLRPLVRDKYKMSNDDCIHVKNGADLVLDDGTVVPNSLLTMPKRLPRKYAYCCDTAYDESIVPIVNGADLLCMESTFDNSLSSLAAERFHCTASQAATIAQQASVGTLMLTHFSARYKDVEPLLAEARQVFPNTVEAYDGLLYEIPIVK